MPRRVLYSTPLVEYSYLANVREHRSSLARARVLSVPACIISSTKNLDLFFSFFPSSTNAQSLSTHQRSSAAERSGAQCSAAPCCAVLCRAVPCCTFTFIHIKEVCTYMLAASGVFLEHGALGICKSPVFTNGRMLDHMLYYHILPFRSIFPCERKRNCPQREAPCNVLQVRTEQQYV